MGKRHVHSFTFTNTTTPLLVVHHAEATVRNALYAQCWMSISEVVFTMGKPHAGG